MDFVEGLLGVGARAVTAEDGVEGALVNDGVEGLVLEVLHGAHIHLLVDQVGVLVLVSLLHLLNSCSGDVNVSDVFVLSK